MSPESCKCFCLEWSVNTCISLFTSPLILHCRATELQTGCCSQLSAECGPLLTFVAFSAAFSLMQTRVVLVIFATVSQTPGVALTKVDLGGGRLMVRKSLVCAGEEVTQL